MNEQLNRIQFLGFFDKEMKQNLFKKINSDCFELNNINIKNITYSDDKILSILFEKDNIEMHIQSFGVEILEISDCFINHQQKNGFDLQFSNFSSKENVVLTVLINRLVKYSFSNKAIQILK